MLIAMIQMVGIETICELHTLTVMNSCTQVIEREKGLEMPIHNVLRDVTQLDKS